MYDHDWTRKLTLPVKMVNGQWEFLLGGSVPVKDGTLAELTVPLDRITDAEFAKRVTAESTVKVLPAGSTLYVALSDRASAMQSAKRFKDLAIDYEYFPGDYARFVAISIGPPTEQQTKQRGLFEEEKEGGLFLRQVGLDRTELLSSSIKLPDGFDPPVAQSLNHAFTLLSERYETHRLSHTGNVYTSMFYLESNGRWYPLDLLREGVRADAERQVIYAAWAELERLLGFRPVTRARPGKKSSRKKDQEPDSQSDSGLL